VQDLQRAIRIVRNEPREGLDPDASASWAPRPATLTIMGDQLAAPFLWPIDDLDKILQRAWASDLSGVRAHDGADVPMRRRHETTRGSS